MEHECEVTAAGYFICVQSGHRGEVIVSGSYFNSSLGHRLHDNVMPTNRLRLRKCETKRCKWYLLTKECGFACRCA